MIGTGRRRIAIRFMRSSPAKSPCQKRPTRLECEGDAMPALSLREMESEARRRLDPAVYDFFAGGADDEITLGANDAAFSHIGLVPRVLRGGTKRELGTTLLGCHLSMP